jgi:hypothetical protein
MDAPDRTVFLFRADGRLLVRAGAGVVHEATTDERTVAATALWPFHRGMWERFRPSD